VDLQAATSGVDIHPSPKKFSFCKKAEKFRQILFPNAD
jgi:hypothetical protein